MRRSICYALLAGFLILAPFVCGHGSVNSPLYGLGFLEEAMAVTGATADIVVFNTWAKLPAADWSDEELKAVVMSAMTSLGYRAGEYELTSITKAQFRQVRTERSGARHVVVTAQVIYPFADKNEPGAYLVINTESQAQTDDIAVLRGRVASAAACGGGSPRISTCLVGWLDGKLDKDKWPETLHKAGQVLGLANAETIVQANYAGIMGYCPYLSDCLVIGDKRININMAIRYSPYDNRTYVVIASPVITGEY